MSNILLESLPTKIQTESGTYEPITDFRASVEFEIMVEKGEEDPYKLLRPYYPNGIPEQEVEAAKAAIWFYQCGNEEKKDTNKPAKSTKPAYSFEVDAPSIYADFLRYYKIDLTTADLHWWKFRELLAGLPTDSAFKERVYYRTCELKGLSKNEQKRIKEIRKQIEIPTVEKGGKITLEERNKQMLEYVKKRSAETGVKICQTEA
jgi:hypothetical protein